MTLHLCACLGPAPGEVLCFCQKSGRLPPEKRTTLGPDGAAIMRAIFEGNPMQDNIKWSAADAAALEQTAPVQEPAAEILSDVIHRNAKKLVFTHHGLSLPVGTKLYTATQPAPVQEPDYKQAFDVWQDKTEWVQETAKPHELGMHRADVLRQRIEAAQPQKPALTADQIEQHIGYRLPPSSMRLLLELIGGHSA